MNILGFSRLKVDFFLINSEPQELPKGNTKNTFQGIHSQVVSFTSCKDFLQIIDMTTDFLDFITISSTYPPGDHTTYHEKWQSPHIGK